MTEVKRVLQNPDLVLASLKSMDSEDDGGLAKQLARVEKDLKKVQVEDSRAVGLYVSGKITKESLTINASSSANGWKPRGLRSRTTELRRP